MLGAATEEQLITRAAAGSAGAWHKLVRRYERRVYNYALRMVGHPDDAADLMQEIFMGAYRNLPGYRGDGAFPAWLFRIASFRCTDYLRRRRPHDPFDEADGSVLSPDEPEVRLLATHANREIAAALARLPTEQRHVVELKFFQGFTFEDIAGQLGISPNTAKTRLYTALRRLRHDEELEMHCEDARDGLLTRLDRNLTEAQGAELSSHLEGCAECRALADDLADLKAQARVWHELTPPPWNPLPAPREPRAAGSFVPVWRRLVLDWLPPAASCAALLVALGVYLEDRAAAPPASGAATQTGPVLTTAAPAEPALAEALLAASREEHQEALAALTTLLKAEMDRRALETEQSLKYVISHQIQSQRQLDALRSRLAADQPGLDAARREQL